MAVEPEKDLKVEIAHVLTIDLVAYSTLLINEQSQRMAELTSIVRNTARFRAAEAEGKLTRLPTGDGMALVFYGDPEAPIECAMQITAELKSQPNVQLRMGIHSGPVNRVLDVNDRSNVAGAGIDLAQRVMDCGDAGHILVSKRVADDLSPYSRWNRYLHELGECEVKHGRKISLFNFHTESLGNPELPRKLKAPARTHAPKIGHHRTWLFAGAGLATCAFIAALAFWYVNPGKVQYSIAVLPFLDLSQAKDQEYFSAGITEQIINSLGKVPGLFVVARSSASSFKDQALDIRVMGKQLGVSHVLEGSVNRNADKVRVDARLVGVDTGYQLWGETYDFGQHEILSLQSDVAKKVVNALELRLQLKEATELAKLPTHDPEAYDFYLRGRYLLNKRTAESVQRGKAAFERAVAEDPRFALGHAGIADAYILLGKIGTITGEEAAARAWPEVSAALAIDDQLSDGYISRGTLLTDFEWNWPAADLDFKKALELNPNSAAGNHWYARHLAEIGRFPEALERIAAAEKQDPLSPTILVAKAKILFVSRAYEQAIASSLKALELEPDFASALSILGQAYAHRSEHSKAIEAASRYVEISGGTGWAKLELAYAYAVADRRPEADAIVNEVTSHPGQFSPYDMATICSAWRDTSGALAWLEKAIGQRSVDVIWIRVDPRLDPMRSHPRFAEIEARMAPRGSISGISK